jgi:hypothetical protein
MYAARYRQKALEDLNAVSAKVQDILTSVGLLPDAIDAKEIEEFCKQAAHVKVIRYRTLEQEFVTAPKTQDIREYIRLEHIVWMMYWELMHLSPSTMAGRERTSEQHCALHSI